MSKKLLSKLGAVLLITSVLTSNVLTSNVHAATIANGVTFYRDANYIGAPVTLGVGNYTMDQLISAGIPNDWMSSLELPSGWTVEVYDNYDFSGTKWTYTSSSPWVGTAVNDKMSSVKIYNGTPAADWSNFQSPTVVFQDQTQGLEGATIFHAAIPNVEQMMKDTCLEICKKIYNNNSEARNNFTKLNLILVNDPNGVAWKSGSGSEITIGISAQYIGNFYHQNGNSNDMVLKEVSGVLAHEGTHGYQYSPNNCGSYTQGTDFFGFIEGTADYVRTVTKGFTPTRYASKGGNWNDGYNTTGFFITWIVNNKKPTFAIELNRTAANYSTWSWDAACKQITGEGVQSLWDQYQKSFP